jgi:hypothetical protein
VLQRSSSEERVGRGRWTPFFRVVVLPLAGEFRVVVLALAERGDLRAGGGGGCRARGGGGACRVGGGLRGCRMGGELRWRTGGL